jgi:hypothetical protein
MRWIATICGRAISGCVHHRGDRSGQPLEFQYAPYGRDVAKAKQLLAGGLSMAAWVMPTAKPDSSPGAVVQQNLADIGIRATINAPEGHSG